MNNIELGKVFTPLMARDKGLTLLDAREAYMLYAQYAQGPQTIVYVVTRSMVVIVLTTSKMIANYAIERPTI